MSQTILNLAPEQGGNRFGPFAGTITFGSDPARCQVVLAAHYGINPVHAQLSDTGTGWTLQPAALGCQVFLRKPNGRTVPVTTAVPVTAGDAVILGTQAGPALTVARLAAGPAVGPRPGAGPGRSIPGSQHLNQNAFAREARRQVESTLVTMPFGREIYRYWTRFRSGAMMRPRYIIGAIVALIALVGTSCIGCGGVLLAWFGLR